MKYMQRTHSLFMGFPLPFRKYLLDEDRLTIKTGFLNQSEQDVYLYHIVDVLLEQSVLDRILKLGTLTCYTTDRKQPTVILKKIRMAKEIKQFLLRQSEAARERSHRYPVMDIGYHKKAAAARPAPGSVV